MLHISIDGLSILGRPLEQVSRVEGLFVGPDGFNGWDDGVDVRRESVDRPAQHGEYDLPTFNGSRVISIDGHALAWSEVELGHLRNRIMGVCAAGERRKLVVRHQGSELWAMVRRGSKPTFVDAGIRHGMHRARFAIFLVAADPRKYGAVHEFAAGAEAVQFGNFPASPRLLVGAGSGGYTVTAGGRQITVANAPAGAHVVDLARGGVFTTAGVRVPGAVSVWHPWSVGPGLPGVVHEITGSRSLLIEVTDTFV